MDNTEINSQQPIRPMSVQEAASYLNVSTSTLYKLTSRRLIGYYRDGGGKKLVFLIDDLNKYLLAHRSEVLSADDH